MESDIKFRQHPLTIPFELDESSKVPIYKQLADGLRESILSLSLMPGQLLPSTRDLSQTLGVSRTTVLRCYEELLSQGYLKSVEGIGTFVSDKLPAQVDSETHNLVNTSLRLSSYANMVASLPSDVLNTGDFQELNFGASPRDLLPRKFWRLMLLKNCRVLEIDDDHYEVTWNPFGYRPLREALTGYLARSRGVRCSPEQVAVYMGSLYGINLIARLFLDEGDCVAVENPGFIYARQVFATHHARICPIPVDRDGMIIDELKRRAPDCRLVYLNASHNDPTGAVMSLERRREILAWAKENGTLILDDDYGGEFRYNGPQIPSLQGLDDADLVVHYSSFWKTLYPLINVGYIVIPRSLIQVAWKAQLYVRDSMLNTSFSALDLSTLTDFIQEGYLERHIRKVHSIYAGRYAVLSTELKNQLGSAVTCFEESNSMHLVVTFHPAFTREHIEKCAINSDFALVSTESYYAENARANEYIVPFAHLEPTVIAKRLRKFAQLLLAGR